MHTELNAGIDADILMRFIRRETQHFNETHPLAPTPAQGWFQGVPLHWMLDWPARLAIQHAEGAVLTDVTGARYNDFCLGDSAAMFGHSPPEVVAALQAQLPNGMTHLLTEQRAERVGQLLVERFALPFWQCCVSASDANRFALRVARAVTARDLVLVFEGCYHGAIEDVLVTKESGKVAERPGLLGQVRDLQRRARVVPFNDVRAVRRALRDQKVACVMAEPVMTNCGMIEPKPGYWDQVHELCLATQTPLLLDETHTLSQGLGGYAAQFGWQPDFKVIGKPIAGGIPAAVWGFNHAIGSAFAELLKYKPAGHSGIGTTLSGNILTLVAMEAVLTHLMTEECYEHMLGLAQFAAQRLDRLITSYGLPWSVSQTGARLEINFSPHPPQTADEVARHRYPEVERALHVGLLNRGQVLTPFHNMMLMSKATHKQQVIELSDAFDDVIRQLV